MGAPAFQYVSTRDGYDIAYTVAGSGRPFVIMPAMWSDLRLRSNPSVGLHVFFEHQDERFRVVHFDLRGSGMSSRGLKPGHSMSDYVTDLEAVLIV